jgi:hypothetical protein
VSPARVPYDLIAVGAIRGQRRRGKNGEDQRSFGFAQRVSQAPVKEVI